MTRLVEQLFLLPIRTLLFTMGKVAETLKGWQHLGEDSLSELAELGSSATYSLQGSGRPPHPRGHSGASATPTTAGTAGREHIALDPPRRFDLRIQSSDLNRLPQHLQPASSKVARNTAKTNTAETNTSGTNTSETAVSNVRATPKLSQSLRADLQIFPKNLKEEKGMYMDQDLSGDQVKVVMYSIVNVVPGIADNERVIAGPCLVAFSDDMSPEDFTAWIIAEKCPNYSTRPSPDDPCGPGDPCPPTGGPYEYPCYPGKEIEKCWDKKYMRVAFSVMGRFNVADINWEQLQAVSLAKMVGELKGIIQHNRHDRDYPDPRVRHEGNALRTVVTNHEKHPVPVREHGDEGPQDSPKKSK